MVRQESNFILLHVVIQFFQQFIEETISFSHWEFLASLSNISGSYMQKFISRLSILFHWSLCLFFFFFASKNTCLVLQWPWGRVILLGWSHFPYPSNTVCLGLCAGGASTSPPYSRIVSVVSCPWNAVSCSCEGEQSWEWPRQLQEFLL